MIEPTH